LSRDQGGVLPKRSNMERNEEVARLRRVVVASGKGGTGKTLLATSLAIHWARQGISVTYADADVEEPNGHLALKPDITSTRPFTVDVPHLVGKCEACGRCQEVCAFNAILALRGRVMVFSELCHGCGACVMACLPQVLQMVPRETGKVREGLASGIRFCDGVLNVSEARATPLIEGVLAASGDGLVVVDAPPGTSCPAVAAVRDSDVAVLVTEPTPFGMHDLALAVGMCKALTVPAAIVVNRSDLGGEVGAQVLGCPVIGRIPFDPQIAAATARGERAIDAVPRFADTVARLAAAVEAFAREARP